jgi:hypothetical protein
VPSACLSAEGFGLNRRLGISRNNEESVSVPVCDCIGEVIIEAFGNINGGGNHGNFGGGAAGAHSKDNGGYPKHGSSVGRVEGVKSAPLAGQRNGQQTAGGSTALRATGIPVGVVSEEEGGLSGRGRGYICKAFLP